MKGKAKIHLTVWKNGFNHLIKKCFHSFSFTIWSQCVKSFRTFLEKLRLSSCRKCIKKVICRLYFLILTVSTKWHKKKTKNILMTVQSWKVKKYQLIFWNFFQFSVQFSVLSLPSYIFSIYRSEISFSTDHNARSTSSSLCVTVTH